MREIKRVFLIVLDSFGIGELPDAGEFGDIGANTLRSVQNSEQFSVPNMQKIGLFHIDGVTGKKDAGVPQGSYGRMAEKSRGKDTTIGHWEIAGIVSEHPMPTYPDGFPEEVIRQFEEQTGRKVLCNKPYSGTEVIREYGKEHVETGALIVYTSADSVFQIAAHEDVVPISELYRICEQAREILQGEHGVGRVIARPFLGVYPEYYRTRNRHDYSLEPPEKTMMDYLQAAGHDTIGIGKIYDIFAGKGISETSGIKDNTDGMRKTIEKAETNFTGLCFVNLVDFDMVYGHRNDIDGYARALTEFDRQLGEFLKKMKPDDLLLITADHGCDPGFAGTDHTREYVPVLAYGKKVWENVSVGTRKTFADTAATVLEALGAEGKTDGESFWQEIKK